MKSVDGLPETIECLYTVNHRAKLEARQARLSNKLDPEHTRHTLRKDALYELKKRVLQSISQYADSVEKHLISERTYYCLYFGSYSFHTPCENFVELEQDPQPTQKLVDFTSSVYTERDCPTCRDALTHFVKKYQYNANDYLITCNVASHASYREVVAAEWPYLPSSTFTQVYGKKPGVV